MERRIDREYGMVVVNRWDEFYMAESARTINRDLLILFTALGSKVRPSAKNAIVDSRWYAMCRACNAAVPAKAVATAKAAHKHNVFKDSHAQD
jgi:hypothetical protein